MSVRPLRLLMSLCLTVVAATAVAAPGPGRYMIEFTDFSGAAAAVRAAGGEVVYEFPEMRVVAARLPEAAVRGLQNNPRVKLMAPEAPRYPLALWNDTTDANGEVTPYGIKMVQADQVSNGASMPRVCIIDSGYKLGHEDLPGTGVSGYSGTLAWNEDGDGHGTHVAGTIAAVGGNSKGVRGVMTSGANLYIVRVFGNDGKWAYESDLVDALNRCRNAGSKVVSMSLGGGKPIGPWEQNAFDSAYNNGVLTIAAAGNAGDTSTSYPAGYASVMSVAAVDADENVASFSQKNADVEIAAPGVMVKSTYPKYENNWLNTSAGNYKGNHVEAAGRTKDGNGVTATLVDGGLCTAAGAWSGRIVLCQRGEVSFKQKVDSVAAGGGVAAVIYNNVSGELLATCDDGTGTKCDAIPAIGLSMENGALAVNSVGTSTTVISTVVPSNTEYTYMDGTSMATPHVSAIAAVVWSHNSGWTNAAVRDALVKTARDKGAAGRDVEYGFGIVQTCGALKFLGGTCGTTTEPPPSGDTTAPTTAVTSPAAGATVSGTVAVTASASDNVGVSKVEFYLNGALAATDSAAPYEWSWNTTAAANGSNTLSSRAYDAAGNVGSSAGVTVTVSNTTTSDTTAPVISNVAARKTHKNGRFEISWSTDEASDSVIVFTGGASGTFTDANMVTSHKMSFSGKSGVLYTYTVSSTDAAGNKNSAGPFTHQN